MLHIVRKAIESQGLNHVEYAEDMYENGNKIGIMG